MQPTRITRLEQIEKKPLSKFRGFHDCLWARTAHIHNHDGVMMLNYQPCSNYSKNTPLGHIENVPLALVGQSYLKKRRYTKSCEIEDLAVNDYSKNGTGITFDKLISSGLVHHKKQAQTTLKRCLSNNVLFTLGDHRPQRYYPTCLKSEVMRKIMSQNISKGVTGLAHLSYPPIFNNELEPLVIQSLEGYVLPLLPSAPLHIHKMQFKIRINSECYYELALPKNKWNNSKEYVEVVGKSRVSFRFYPKGTVIVFCESSNNASKLEDEVDLSRLIAFFGQIRDRLITLLADKHERIVPDIMCWELTQCDINKDIKVSHWFQYSGIKVQVKHFDHLFRVYIKSTGKETVCRVEESCNPYKSTAIQAITEILNPHEKIYKKLSDIYNLLAISHFQGQEEKGGSHTV